MSFPFTKITLTLTFPSTSSERFLKTMWSCSPYFAPNKTQLTTLTLWVFFFFFFNSTGNTARRLQSQTLNTVLLILQFLILPEWLAIWARSILAMFSRRVKRYQGQGEKPTSQARSMATKQSLEELQRAWVRILSNGAKCLWGAQRNSDQEQSIEKRKKKRQESWGEACFVIRILDFK